jgi:hypothetical protein
VGDGDKVSAVAAVGAPCCLVARSLGDIERQWRRGSQASPRPRGEDQELQLRWKQGLGREQRPVTAAATTATAAFAGARRLAYSEIGGPAEGGAPKGSEQAGSLAHRHGQVVDGPREDLVVAAGGRRPATGRDDAF